MIRYPQCQWISSSGATEPDCGMEASLCDGLTSLNFCQKHAILVEKTRPVEWNIIHRLTGTDPSGNVPPSLGNGRLSV